MKAQSLLLKYSGYTKDRRCLKPHKELSRSEFRELCHLTSSDFPSLSSFFTKLCSDTEKAKSPSEYREFLAELARNSPACGIFQIRGEQQIINTISLIVSGSIDIFKSTNHSHLAALQTTVPILAKFLQACKRDQRGRPSDEVCNILLHILKVCQAPFLDSPPSSNQYTAPTDDALALFPSLPKLIGTTNYSADKKQSKKVSDACRKESCGHPSLCPGIFTIFCHHGVYYGFQVMDTCKSPKHPFEIFRSRFETAPDVIIYDNAC